FVDFNGLLHPVSRYLKRLELLHVLWAVAGPEYDLDVKRIVASDRRGVVDNHGHGRGVPVAVWNPILDRSKGRVHQFPIRFSDNGPPGVRHAVDVRKMSGKEYGDLLNTG